MKKNKLIVPLNWILLFTLPIILLTVNVDTTKTTAKISPKKLSTSIIFSSERIDEIKKEKLKTKQQEKEQEEAIIEEEEATPKEAIEKSTEDVEKEVVAEPVIEEKEEEKPVQASDVLRSYTGKMSFYNANCRGCSGVTSTGTDISDGRLYYYDNNYGNLRIIAAGPEIKKWSIVRLKNTSFGNSILAIVLDRGGAIGEGRTFLIDMLTNKQEGKDGVERNITVEVLRDGK